MRIQNAFLYLLIAAALMACRKDKTIPSNIIQEDFRDKYVGEYELCVRSYHWQMGTDAYWEEDTLIGEVFKYDSTQNYSPVLNTSSPFDTPAETSSGLTIRFLAGAYSNCYVYQNDTIRSDGGYHYYHEGYFKGDSLYFNVTGLGGLGGGADYYTKGKKL